jgi:hypothetical protein
VPGPGTSQDNAPAQSGAKADRNTVAAFPNDPTNEKMSLAKSAVNENAGYQSRCSNRPPCRRLAATYSDRM